MFLHEKFSAGTGSRTVYRRKRETRSFRRRLIKISLNRHEIDCEVHNPTGIFARKDGNRGSVFQQIANKVAITSGRWARPVIIEKLSYARTSAPNRPCQSIQIVPVRPVDRSEILSKEIRWKLSNKITRYSDEIAENYHFPDTNNWKEYPAYYHQLIRNFLHRRTICPHSTVRSESRNNFRENAYLSFLTLVSRIEYQMSNRRSEDRRCEETIVSDPWRIAEDDSGYLALVENTGSHRRFNPNIVCTVSGRKEVFPSFAKRRKSQSG